MSDTTDDGVPEARKLAWGAVFRHRYAGVATFMRQELREDPETWGDIDISNCCHFYIKDSAHKDFQSQINTQRFLVQDSVGKYSDKDLRQDVIFQQRLTV